MNINDIPYPYSDSFSAVSKPKFASTKVNARLKALGEIYIFSFAAYQISVIFQDFCTIFTKFDAIFVDFP